MADPPMDPPVDPLNAAAADLARLIQPLFDNPVFIAHLEVLAEAHPSLSYLTFAPNQGLPFLERLRRMVDTPALGGPWAGVKERYQVGEFPGISLHQLAALHLYTTNMPYFLIVNTDARMAADTDHPTRPYLEGLVAAATQLSVGGGAGVTPGVRYYRSVADEEWTSWSRGRAPGAWGRSPWQQVLSVSSSPALANDWRREVLFVEVAEGVVVVNAASFTAGPPNEEEFLIFPSPRLEVTALPAPLPFDPLLAVPALGLLRFRLSIPRME